MLVIKQNVNLLRILKSFQIQTSLIKTNKMDIQVKVETTGGDIPKTSKKLNVDKQICDKLLTNSSSQWGNGDNICPSTKSGMDHLNKACLNKGMAFSLQERQTLGIHGLLPPRVKTQDEQLLQCRMRFERLTDDLEKYMYLMALLGRNQKLFFKFVYENVKEVLPYVYTPVVGLACQNFGLVYEYPRGLFISIHDQGHVYDILRNWPEPEVRAICVTDGGRILGLGDLGAFGMGIPIGKLSLYTAMAGVKPHYCLPITLDVGTNTKKVLEDPLYLGIRQERVNDYDIFMDEFMDSVVQRFGQNTLIQFEDFGNASAFKYLNKYRNTYCCFNDDIQGTAAVVLAGIYAALRITETKLSNHVYLFQGAGEANLGVANLIIMAMKDEGVSRNEALSKMWIVDSKGLIVKDRPEGGITEEKAVFARNHAPISSLKEVVESAKPSVLIGASTITGAFTPEILTMMAKFNSRPIIFALSNPTVKAECTAEDAYKYTDGRALFASGSPFNEVTYNGKIFHPAQANNSYVFPGLGLSVTSVAIRTITDEMFLEISKALAHLINEEDLEKGSLYPPLSSIREVSLKLAVKIAEFAYKSGLAAVTPKPNNLEAFIKAQVYDPTYEPSLPVVYSYP